MTNSPAAAPLDVRTDAERLYRDTARDPRYGHHLRIPERICRCLDYFGADADRGAVRERLRTYYLFIGVADDRIDAGRLEAGLGILEQFAAPVAPPEGGPGRAAVWLLTEALRRHAGPDLHAAVLSKLWELYRAVVGERQSATMRAYIEQRKAVGRLTAEVSYILIRPLLGGEREDLRRFFQEVGEVGCLVDSVIDLRSDERHGLLSFRPTTKDRLHLAVRTAGGGLRVLLRHPRLLGLFLEAAGDDLLDRLRARSSPPASESGLRISIPTV